jgi:hypothetical protein
MLSVILVKVMPPSGFVPVVPLGGCFGYRSHGCHARAFSLTYST